MNSLISKLKKKFIKSNSIGQERLTSRSTSLHHAHISQALTFVVHKAAGGFVIETRRYNETADDDVSLYIITEEQDLGTEISKILIIHSLRR